MMEIKVKDKRGTEYILIQFVVIDNKLTGILKTLNGQFFTEEYQNLEIVQ